MFLNEDTFSQIIKNTPLIAIDLIVENDKNQILLGKRINEPALGLWFVPGGRVFKDESLDHAFERIAKEELHLDLHRSDAKFYKIYEHFYDNNVFNSDFTTHYIILSHKIRVNKLPKLDKQHSQSKWFTVEKLLKNSDVHDYTKDYFI